MLRQILNMLSFIVAAIMLLLTVTVIQLWPASFWLDVRTVRVFDTPVGQPVVMAVDRTINRDFRGDWLASIRTLQNGKWIQFCNARGSSNYRTDSTYPDPLTLKWWTHPDCNPLPPGKYLMRTSWIIKGESFLPDKITTADSNIFEIK